MGHNFKGVYYLYKVNPGSGILTLKKSITADNRTQAIKKASQNGGPYGQNLRKGRYLLLNWSSYANSQFFTDGKGKAKTKDRDSWIR